MNKSEISEEYLKIVNEMKNSLLRKLNSRGVSYIDDVDLEDEIFDAIDAVNERRRFDSTPLCLFELKYQSLIVKLALSSVLKYGAEGETSHSENGINRSYDNSGEYPESLMSRIVPLAKAR
jgi:hypothetical protein